MSIRLDQNSFDLQGECPVCRSSDLNYNPADIDNDTISYDWTCNNCGSQGTEWYTMEFYSQNLKYDWLQKKSTEDPGWEREPKSHI